MRKEDNQYSFVSQIDVATGVQEQNHPVQNLENADIRTLMAAMVTAQNRQNDLLEEVVEQLGSAQRQRTMELANWKRMNPHLAVSCRNAAQKLGKIQTEFLSSLSEEIDENFDAMTDMDSDYYFNEFLDRFGPRFMHLNVLLQMLAQLSDKPVTT